MKTSRKIISFLLAIALVTLLFTGCSQRGGSTLTEDNSYAGSGQSETISSAPPERTTPPAAGESRAPGASSNSGSGPSETTSPAPSESAAPPASGESHAPGTSSPAGSGKSETISPSSSESTVPPAAKKPLTTNGGAVIPLSSLGHRVESGNAPAVYYISDITPDSLMEIYGALNWTPTGKVAVKLSTGEPPASNYLDPNLIKDLVQSVDGTIVECNTAYGGSRASTAMHYQVAADHGFTAIADFQILDENGSMTLPVAGGTRLTENYVGAAFGNYDSYLVLSHFKGHSMAGFGGAIKNISIGLGSREGKCWIHSAGTSRTSPWGGVQDAFCEAMGDAGKAVSNYLGNGERIVYINVMNRISIDCDCNGSPAEPDIHDIGILASTDPVALDQACIDLVWVSEGSESFIRRVESRNGLHTLENAETIGLGSRSYRLVNLDD